ncbi:hypothetical protein [Maricaulis sp.]|uniref:hypothetical protein n=1 Tax=Maricaulis sp. TaxID=1486257 RepID=UPI002608E1E6|nr:hypothetical protein [Maricaulis sp.]
MPFGLWAWIFNKRAHAIRERRFEGVKGRGSLVETDDGRCVIPYFANVNSDHEDFVEASVLESGKSSDDHWRKGMIGLYLLAGLVALYFIPRVSENIHGVFSQNGEISIGPFVYLVLAALVLGGFVFAITIIHFVNISQEWGKALNKLFSNDDTYQQLMGIRFTLLEFRRFIKWRRVMSVTIFVYFLVLAAISLDIYEDIKDGKIIFDRAELFLLSAWVPIQLISICIVSYLRWRYTNWRSPTLQFCIMLVEQKRAYVALMRRGRGAG